MRKVPSVSMIIGIIFCAMGLVLMCAGVAATVLGNSAGEGGETMLFLYIFGGIGLLFLIIGLPFLIVGIKKRKTKMQLLETGVQTVGIITGVERNLQVTVNGRHPFRAECQVTDPVTGEIYLYSSESVMRKIDYLIGCQVTVFYDPDDRSKYYVDIESAERDYGAAAPEVHDFR